jgi:hypothetical protein
VLPPPPQTDWAAAGTGNASSDAQPSAAAALSAVKAMRAFNTDPSPRPRISATEMREIPGPLAPKPLAQRQITGIPPSSAMTFNAAIVTSIAVSRDSGRVIAVLPLPFVLELGR